MSPGFYELLGVEPTTSAARIKSAYGQARSRLNKQRRTRVAAGESVEELDRSRVKLDEAWEVLSDPLRRRRYDALLQWQAGPRTTDADEVWALVGEALVHPAAQVAARLLRVTSQLVEIGDLPRAPSGAAVDPETLVPHDDDVTHPVIRNPKPRGHLRLVEGGPREGGVIPYPSPRTPRIPDPPSEVTGAKYPPLPPDEVAFLLQENGYSGAFLRAVRERMGMTVRALCAETRFKEAFQNALEAEDWDLLPSVTFVRGYVREVARTLGLDDDKVVTGYMARYPRRS